MVGRVAIFIDSNNLRNSLQNQFGKYKINFEAFAAKLCGNRQLIRTYYYIPRVTDQFSAQQASNQQRFLSMLRRTPYLTVRMGRLVQQNNVWTEKGIDVKIG
jgi:uncharacterized LabA/DUF88 family protein